MGVFGEQVLGIKAQSVTMMMTSLSRGRVQCKDQSQISCWDQIEDSLTSISLSLLSESEFSVYIDQGQGSVCNQNNGLMSMIKAQSVSRSGFSLWNELKLSLRSGSGFSA